MSAGAYRLVEDRVEAVAEAVSIIGLDGILVVEERLDPQYSYITSTASRIGAGAAALAALLVALASYRLAMRAEEWWKCFSTMIPSLIAEAGAESVYRGVLRFIEECRGSVVGREGKIKRIRRAWAGARRVLEDLYLDPAMAVREPDSIAEALRKALGEKDYTKTVVFSVKMAYYAARSVVGRVPLRTSLPMPVDVRVACATYASLMVDGPGYRGLVSNPAPARRAWGRVSEATGIPQLHLDTLAWLTGWAPRDLPLEEAKREIVATLSQAIEPSAALRIASEICKRRCMEG